MDGGVPLPSSDGCDDGRRGGVARAGMPPPEGGGDPPPGRPVASRREAVILQAYINNIDPRAFVTIINSNEILGEGFKSLQEKMDQ